MHNDWQSIILVCNWYENFPPWVINALKPDIQLYNKGAVVRFIVKKWKPYNMLELGLHYILMITKIAEMTIEWSISCIGTTHTQWDYKWRILVLHSSSVVKLSCPTCKPCYLVSCFCNICISGLHIYLHYLGWYI